MAESTTGRRASVTKLETTPETAPSTDYVLPVVGVPVPSIVVDAAFWGGLAGSVALGVIKPPLGVLLGAGVVVARHQARTHLQRADG